MLGFVVKCWWNKIVLRIGFEYSVGFGWLLEVICGGFRCMGYGIQS